MIKKSFTLLGLAAMTIFSCSEDDSDITSKSQFADAVISFSTEYNTSPGDWSAIKATGEPDVYPEYGDIVDAWAASTANQQREFLELSFKDKQRVDKIEIYETYNPGAVDTLYLRNATTQQWQRVWTGSAVTDLPDESRIFSVTISRTNFDADAIRIAINSPAVTGYNEIDAVKISVGN